MPHDPARLADAGAWFAKAASDLRAAEHDLVAKPPLTDDVLFHAQQAAEKSMKGFLAWHDLAFRKTHDLSELGRQCESLDASLEPVLKRAQSLTVFAWAFRYPGEHEQPPLDEALTALTLAREVYETLLRLLPAEARP